MVTDPNRPKNDDEIDFGQLLQLLGKFFLRGLKVVYDIVSFYRRKWVFFISLIVVGLIIGSLWDAYIPHKSYRQEIIIEPGYESTILLYDFVKKFSANRKDSLFLSSSGIGPSFFEQMDHVSMEPVYQYTDILEFFLRKYSDRDAHHVLAEMDPDDFESEGYKNFYKFHRLTFCFKSNDPKNAQASAEFLKLLAQNSYFDKQIAIALNQSNIEIDEGKKSLAFVNDYLDEVVREKAEGRLTKRQDMLLINGNESISAVSSLLGRKSEILEKISFKERNRSFGNVLFQVISVDRIKEFSNWFSTKKIVFPIMLFLLTSLIYFIKYCFLRFELLIRNQ